MLNFKLKLFYQNSSFFILLYLLTNLSFAAAPPATSNDLSSSASGNDTSLNWSAIVNSLYGGGITIDHYNIYRGIAPNFIADMTTGTNRIAQPTSNSYTDTNALTSTDSYYYRITAVTTEGAESLVPSNLAFKVRNELTFNALGSNTYWFSQPASSGWSTASTIGSAVANVTHVIQWDASTQSEVTYDVMNATGTDFSLLLGHAYAVTISADTTLNLLGNNPQTPHTLTHNSAQFNHHWMGLPVPNKESTAAALAQAMGANITKVARYDTATDQYQSWFTLNNTWMGDDFMITPGMAALVSVKAASQFTPVTGFPSVNSSSLPDKGYETITIDLDGMVTAPNGIATYQWDYEGDGLFDTTSNSTAATQFTYTINGTYYPTLLITDNLGHKAVAYATVTLQSLGVDFSLDGFDPNNSESSSINFTLPEDGMLSVFIYDENGNRIKTLLDGVATIAGSQAVNWDGTNDSAAIVADGSYYVVIQFSVNGHTSIFDTRNNSGGIDITSNLTNIVIDNTLSPLTGDYIDINYTLPENALVTILIKDQSGATIRTLLNAIPRSAGAHIEVWDGAMDSGAMVTPGSAFTVAISTTSLATNSLITTGNAPQLSNITAVSARFSPASNPYGVIDDNKNNAVVSFDLNKTADVTMTVYNATGLIVKTETQTAITAGTGKIIKWNGKNTNGVNMASGLYTLRLQATENAQSSAVFTLQTEIFY